MNSFGIGDIPWLLGDCQPMLLRCGLPFALPVPRFSLCVGGSSVGGGPYMAGCEVNDGLECEPPKAESAGEVDPDRGLWCDISPLRCGGMEPAALM